MPRFVRFNQEQPVAGPSSTSKLRPQQRKDYKLTANKSPKRRSQSEPRSKGKSSGVKVVVDTGLHQDFASFAIEGPATFEDAVNANDSSEWIAAMQDEMNALHENGTWVLVKREPQMNIVRNKWVFVVKRKADGSIDRYRARLVAKGFSQKPGIDFHETFSPVARYDTIRILLSLVPAFNLKVCQFDIKTAFLNGDLDETVFMEQPEGFKSEGDMVCLLKKSLYGLKQSPRQWSIKVTSVMKQLGFYATKSDPCVFINHYTQVIVCLYVDDGLIFGSSSEKIETLMQQLEQHFQINIGDSGAYAGMQIEYGSGFVFIHQQSYLQRVLERFGMQDAKPVTTPADPHVRLVKAEDHACQEPLRELIGSLMYLAVVSRPDIAYAVSLVSQYMTCYDNSHWTAAKRILQYLRGTMNKGIMFDQSDIRIMGFSDSDFAGDNETRRSRSGTVIMMNGGPVVWGSNRQPIVTLSSAEAEFVAANAAVTSIKWMHELLHEVDVKINSTDLFVDNQAAIKMIKNPEFHMRTKHIDLRFKYIRERYQDGLFDIQYVPSEEQVADALTKPLSKGQFRKLTSYFMTERND
jgi:hypothetical protein